MVDCGVAGGLSDRPAGDEPGGCRDDAGVLLDRAHDGTHGDGAADADRAPWTIAGNQRVLRVVRWNGDDVFRCARRCGCGDSADGGGIFGDRTAGVGENRAPVFRLPSGLFCGALYVRDVWRNAGGVRTRASGGAAGTARDSDHGDGGELRGDRADIGDSAGTEGFGELETRTVICSYESLYEAFPRLVVRDSGAGGDWACDGRRDAAHSLVDPHEPSEKTSGDTSARGDWLCGQVYGAVDCGLWEGAPYGAAEY